MKMKRIYLVTALGALLYSCAPTTAEPIVENVTERAAPTGSAAEGKMLYLAKCQKCHKLKNIDDYNSERWDVVLPDMASKAKIEMKDQTLIGHYVKWELAN